MSLSDIRHFIVCIYKNHRNSRKTCKSWRINLQHILFFSWSWTNARVLVQFGSPFILQLEWKHLHRLSIFLSKASNSCLLVVTSSQQAWRSTTCALSGTQNFNLIFLLKLHEIYKLNRRKWRITSMVEIGEIKWKHILRPPLNSLFTNILFHLFIFF